MLRRSLVNLGYEKKRLIEIHYLSTHVEIDMFQTMTRPALTINPVIGSDLLKSVTSLWINQALQKPIQNKQATNPIDWSNDLGRIADTGDVDAFKSIFEYFAPRVKAYIMRLDSDNLVAEELTQEVMSIVWRKAKQYDSSKAAASTWIFTIARNLRIDTFRKEKRPDLDPYDPSLAPDPDISSEELVFAKQKATRLNTAIKKLPSEQRQVLHLSFYEDFSHAEIAKQLDLPLGTVKSRIRLAFQRIKNSLGEEL